MRKTNCVRLTVPVQEDYLRSAKLDALAIVCANVRLNIKKFRLQTQNHRPISIDQFDDLVTLKKDYKAPSAEEEFIKSDSGSELIEYFKSVLKRSSYSELEREALKRMILDGKSAPEVARQLGLKPYNIKTAYKNGMWKCRPVMEAVI